MEIIYKEYPIVKTGKKAVGLHALLLDFSHYRVEKEFHLK